MRLPRDLLCGLWSDARPRIGRRVKRRGKTACHLFSVDTKKIEAAAKEKPAKADSKANPDLPTARKSTEAMSKK
jgi:hypothetical protein